MAKAYVDVTTGSAPVQYQYILLETGKGQPVMPETSLFEVTPPLKERTARGDFYVSLDWKPPVITAGNETTFTVDIADKDQFPASQADLRLDNNGFKQYHNNRFEKPVSE